MTTFLCFNDFTFSPVTRDNQPWFKSSEIARALGYKREDFLSKLYRKNADEFTPDMTQVVENRAERRNGVPGNLSDGRVRIFSLRGCHLLAMFARTPVAKAFRAGCWTSSSSTATVCPPNSPSPSPHHPPPPTASRSVPSSTHGQSWRMSTSRRFGLKSGRTSSLNASTIFPWNGSPTPLHGCRARSTN